MSTISQSFIPWPGNIRVSEFSRRQAGNAARILQNRNESHFGLAIKQSTTGDVESLALATVSEVFVIELDGHSDVLPHDKPFEDLLAGNTGTLFGFEMAKLALHLYRSLGIAKVYGVDLSTICSESTREPWRPGKFVARKIYAPVNQFDLDSLWGVKPEQRGHRDVCLRAWISARAAEVVQSEVDKVLKVNTSFLNPKELACIGEFIRQADLLEAIKPSEVPGEFSSAVLTKDGTLSLQNSRYRTRVRRSNQTSVIITNNSGHEFIGQARRSNGKNTDINFVGPRLSGEVQKVRVVGRQEATNSEKARDELVLKALRGEIILRNYPLVRSLWFPSRNDLAKLHAQYAPQPNTISGLNDSQAKVVSAMMSESPLVIVHGPPGTGKTTTISAAASIWGSNRKPTWITAHSNVAVKNIAESLFKRGVDFRLLVSKEFHFQWHEHIYQLIEERLMRPDELPKEIVGMEKMLGGSCIILSTLSMLMNQGLDHNGMFKLVPVEKLIIDEASQIKIFEFMPVFAKFKELKKVCFFGDPKQLPPYGNEAIPDLKTIFDIDHLRDSNYFLNTQYRMPIPLGHFISRNVYQGKLLSEHTINQMSCVSFINVSRGQEIKGGFSWKNQQEITAIVDIVRLYYRHRNFCIITPYDAQRAAIEQALKSENLPWEHVFNVDSFQGNEADFVLLSVVRSEGPGFLTSLNRMNVMLTRCRKGLVVVTSHSFLEQGGKYTLLGKLVRHWTDCKGGEVWVDWREVAEGRVDLPGAPGPKREARMPLFALPRQLNGVPAYTPVPAKKFDVSKLFRKPSQTPAPMAFPPTSSYRSSMPAAPNGRQHQNVYPSLGYQPPKKSWSSPKSQTSLYSPTPTSPIRPPGRAKQGNSYSEAARNKRPSSTIKFVKPQENIRPQTKLSTVRSYIPTSSPLDDGWQVVRPRRRARAPISSK